MAEFIDRSAFLEKERRVYCETCKRRENSKWKVVYEIGEAPCRACEIGDVLDDLEDVPAADVRPVVLRRDCLLRRFCMVAQFLREDGFCSNGEKREES